jgi:hypothetical protein
LQGEATVSEYPYRGYVIEPAPYELTDSRRWLIYVYVLRYRGDGSVTSKSFSAKSIFETQNEAEEAIAFFAQKIIDGEIPGCSVDDL